jgi:hypothetical protein
MAEYSKALLYNKRALDIFQESPPENHSSLATTYSKIGYYVYEHKRALENALLL